LGVLVGVGEAGTARSVLTVLVRERGGETSASTEDEDEMTGWSTSASASEARWSAGEESVPTRRFGVVKRLLLSFASRSDGRAAADSGASVACEMVPGAVELLSVRCRVRSVEDAVADDENGRRRSDVFRFLAASSVDVGRTSFGLTGSPLPLTGRPSVVPDRARRVEVEPSAPSEAVEPLKKLRRFLDVWLNVSVALAVIEPERKSVPPRLLNGPATVPPFEEPRDRLLLLTAMVGSADLAGRATGFRVCVDGMMTAWRRREEERRKGGGGVDARGQAARSAARLMTATRKVGVRAELGRSAAPRRRRAAGAGGRSGRRGGLTDAKQAGRLRGAPAGQTCASVKG
jgi:hypothetical protein